MESSWKSAQRQRGRFVPLDVEAKLTLKNIETEIARQLKHCNEQVQQDLDKMHTQLQEQVGGAVTALETKLASARGEAAGDLAKATTMLGDELKSSLGKLSEAVAASATKVELKNVEEALRKEAVDAETASEQRLQTLGKKVDLLDERLSQDLQALKSQAQAISDRLDASVEEGVKGRAALADALNAAAEDARASNFDLIAQFRAESAENEAKHHATNEALAEMGRSVATQLQTSADDLQLRLDNVLKTLSDTVEQAKHQTAEKQEALESSTNHFKEDVNLQFTATKGDLQQITAECRDGLHQSQAAWVRAVDWNAQVDLEQLARDRHFDVESPAFSAATLRDLRLRLRLTPLHGGDSQRFSCGAFLISPHGGGQVNFRLQVGSKSQSFSAKFNDSPEAGTAKLTVFDRIGAAINVRLEILDVTGPIASGPAMPLGHLSGTIAVVDAAQFAKKEAETLRSRMVRRIEWKVAHAAERLTAAKKALAGLSDGEGLEPICSPPFSAGGFDGLQFQLYPIGYKPDSDEMRQQCGFFLVAPRGVYVKCRAFVADQVRNFDHTFETKDPYGRSNFCRLHEKIGEDDTILCGIELVEIRQELSAQQVRGSPFGYVADQVKLTLHPHLGGMDHVRELKEVPQDRRAGSSLRGNMAGGKRSGGVDLGVSLMSKTGPTPSIRASSTLGTSQSLPMLHKPASAAGAENSLRPFSGQPPLPGLASRTLPKI